MNKARSANLLGALVLALADDLIHETETRAQQGAAAPAALVSLGVSPGESIEELARTLGLSHSATVRLVDRLAQAELLERRVGLDKRTSALHLTRKGHARRRAILQGRNRLLTEALSPLSEEEQIILTELMETLLRGLTRDRQHADHICRLCNEEICPGETCPVECSVT